MKLIIIIAFFLVSTNAFAQNGWRYLNSGVSYFLNSVEFANENFGIVVGDSGTALKTTDGGQNWQQMNLPADIELFKTTFTSVAFADENSAIIVGKQIIRIGNYSRYFPIVLRSSDAGQTWQPLNLEKEQKNDTTLYNGTSFISVCMSDKLNGFLAVTHTEGTGGSFIYKTMDSGQNWELYKEYPAYSFGIEQLECSKENSLIISIRTPERVHGSESGRINTIIEKPDSNLSRKFSQNNLYTYYGGLIVQSMEPNSWINYKTDGSSTEVMNRSFDDGLTWIKIESAPQSIEGLFFNGSNHGYAILSSESFNKFTILKTVDAGNTWIPQKHPADIPYIRDIYSINDTLAYAIGAKGIILKVSDDATSINDTQSEFLKETKVYPNPAADELIIDGISEELTLINSFGEIVWRGFKNEEKLKIDVSGFPQGIYVLKYSAGAQMISVVR